MYVARLWSQISHESLLSQSQGGPDAHGPCRSVDLIAQSIVTPGATGILPMQTILCVRFGNRKNETLSPVALATGHWHPIFFIVQQWHPPMTKQEPSVHLRHGSLRIISDLASGKPPANSTNS